MWILRITLDLYGEKFSPKALLKNLNEPFINCSSNEPDDLNDRDPESVYGFGSLSLISPNKYGLQYELAEYENWYFDFLDRNKKLLDASGVESINLFIEVFHNGGQLNFYIFSRELLKKVGQYEIEIPISYYKLSSKQLIELIKETNISIEKLKQYIAEG